MEKDYFINTGIPSPLHCEPTMQWNSGQNHNWDHHFNNPFDSAFNSILPVFNNLNNNNNSTPVNSPQKLHIPNLASSTDPGFAQRAAKFSCFGSRSFNGRTSSPLELSNNAESLTHRSVQQLGYGKLPRVSSSPSLKQAGSPLQIKNLGKIANCNESGSEPSGETGSKTPTELNSRKRKSVSRVKTKENSPVNGNTGGEVDDSERAKRCKTGEGTNGTEKGSNVNMEESEGNEMDETKTTPEPPKDYIHVRARRGQATDSHSLAERVRREKISERMKLLQDLVPGCNKVTGKALMLDEIINYVQSLQRQVEFLSMKLASVNPSLDFPAENLLPKDICQPNGSILPSYQQTPQPPQQHTDILNGALSQCSVDTLDTSLCRSLGMQLPPLDGLGDYLNQFPTMCEDDLQSLVQMGFSQDPNKHLALQSQGFPGKNTGKFSFSRSMFIPTYINSHNRQLRTSENGHIEVNS